MHPSGGHGWLPYKLVYTSMLTLSPSSKVRAEECQEGVLGRGRVTSHPDLPGAEGLPGM